MSSSKKKSMVAQCRCCSAYFLTRDLQKHVGVIPDSESSPVSSKQIRKTTGRNMASPSMGKAVPKCDKISYLQSQLQTIEPDQGMAVLAYNLSRREEYAPTEFHGWERYSFALIHPETLNQLEAFPQSPALAHITREDSGETQVESFDIVTLWPSPEVPQIRVSFPTETPIKLDQVMPISLIKYAKFLNQIAIKPVNLSEQPERFAEALPKLGHFPLYLRSYFANAYVSPELLLKVHYYGRILLFRSAKYEAMESDSKDDRSDEIESKLEKMLTIKDEREDHSFDQSRIDATDEEIQQLPQVFRVHPSVTFTVIWDDTEEELCLR